MIETLAPGTRLGPYELLELIGTGGMGQVYRARDSRLERDVAIKTLAGPAKHDADLLRRFETEAKAVGALDHPNLLVVYDIGRDGDVSYIVSELLDGETLRARLQDGALSMRQVIDYTMQVARGLAAAHARGVIHRDLKPENLFVMRDGRVKILDFGIAKLSRAAEVDAATVAAGFVTDVGVTVGTAGYMAPEQVRGDRNIDYRADIFALGLVMYEMASGRRPFLRDTIPETLTAILKDEAPELPAGVNPAVARIISRCLEKHPEHRFHSAHDLSLAIELLSASTISTTAPPAAAAALGDRAPAISRRRVIAYGAASIGLVAAGAGLRSWLPGPRAAAVPSALRRLTFRRGVIRSARVAPDGQTYLVGAAWDGGACHVYAGRLDSAESNPLDLPAGNVLAISRSGEIALALGDQNTAVFSYGTLARVPITGGAPRQMLEHVKFADWSPDGRELAIIRRVEGLDQLEYPIGNVLVRAKPEAGSGLAFVRISADGQRIAFVRSTGPYSLAGRVIVVDLRGTVMKRSDEYLNIHGLAWKGDEIWYTAADDAPLFRILRALTRDGAERTIMRVPTNLTLWDTLPNGRAMFAQTDDHGIMIARAGDDVNERTLSWLDFSYPTDIGRDGQTFLFNELGQSVGTSRSVAYLRRLDGAPPVRLGDGFAYALSPDGRQIIWSPAVTYPQLEIISTGAGSPHRLPGSGLFYTKAKWLPDGRRVVGSASSSGGRPKLVVVELGTGQTKTISPEGVGPWAVSHDGSAIAATGPDGAIRVYPVDGSAPRDVPGLTGAETPIGWLADALLVTGSGGQAHGDIHKVSVRTGRRELWTNILPRDPAGILLLSTVEISPDGRSLVYLWARALSNLYLAEGLG